MAYTRFELYLDGEKQDMGFMVGLTEVTSDEDLIEELMEPFNRDLPNRYVPTPDYRRTDGYTASYFTEKGMNHFEQAIQALIDTIEGEGWEVHKEVIDGGEFLYEDEYQVVLFKPFDDVAVTTESLPLADARLKVSIIPNFYGNLVEISDHFEEKNVRLSMVQLLGILNTTKGHGEFPHAKWAKDEDTITLDYIHDEEPTQITFSEKELMEVFL